MESAGASAEELEAFIGSSRSRNGQYKEDLVNGQAYCGAIAGIIKEIKNAAEVVQDIVTNYDKVLAKLK